MTTKPLPSPAVHGHPMDLIRQIVDLGASDPNHPDFDQHASLANRVHSAIWAWSKLDPEEAQACGERLMLSDRHSELRRLGPHALLAAAHHSQTGPRIPFKARAQPEWPWCAISRNAIGEVKIGARIQTWEDTAADTPWPDEAQSCKVFRLFDEIASHVSFHDPARLELDAEEILNRYDLCMRQDDAGLSRPVLEPAEWRGLAMIVEACRIGAGIPRAASLPSAPAPRL